MTKTFSPSEAAFSVFELAKRQPQFVLRFCIIYALVLMIIYALAGATGVGAALQGYIALAAGGRPPNPQRVLEVLAPASMGFFILAVFGLFSGAMTAAMALRKAIRDEDSGFFGLQFGKDEINLLLAMLLMGGILIGVNFIFGLIGGFATGGNAGVMILVVFIAFMLMSFVGIRLSQFGVLTIASQNISVIPSWNETKGQVWRFIGAHLLWIIIASIIGLIAQSVGGIGAGAMKVNVGSGMPETLGAFFKPGWLFYTLIYGLASGFGNLGSICIGAYAWHQMRGDLPAPKTII